jgi:hypothetical protein
MSRMSRVVMAGFVLAMSLIAQAAAQTVGGTYTLAGKNFDGSNYKGVVQITPQGSTCRITWQTGGSQSEGVCMQSDTTLAAFYKLGTEYGLVIYKLQPDGSLQGRWSVAGKQGVGIELLMPQK